jgi:hypothetical protein
MSKPAGQTGGLFLTAIFTRRRFSQENDAAKKMLALA